jgi:hypothetical protein
MDDTKTPAVKAERSERAKTAVRHRVQPFPPGRDYASLSVRDLLDAREAYHVHLSRLENVVATAIGRYRIHEDDWYAKNPPDRPRPAEFARVTKARTLANTVVRPWSWPAVLVFVRSWRQPHELGEETVPRSLYLPDGRVVPTSVILAEPDESLPPPAPGPAQVSELLGGGYSCLREHQGERNLGTLACLVQKGGTYYALTSRHVAGGKGEEVRAIVRGKSHRVGLSSDEVVGRLPVSTIFPDWPPGRTYLNLDAALVRIDDVSDWTAQAFGIGEIGELFDATAWSISLDLVGCPVRAFGGTSGVMEGEIQALFYRYQSLGGFDYATDVLIGPRRKPLAESAEEGPITRPGDSGAIWFYDPPEEGGRSKDMERGDAPPERGRRARRLRPVAMQWGGQRFLSEDRTTSSAFALGSFLSSVCRALDVELVRDWSTGHDEYWGKIGHFSIGWKACSEVTGRLRDLMMKNRDRIGFPDETVSKGEQFRVDREGFVPLADVPDYVWITRTHEGVQHFADVDIVDIAGGPSLLERCAADPSQVSAQAWKAYFDGFAAAGVGPEEGTLPFRVWQLWEEMVARLKQKNASRFVAAAGVLAHYIGDASQPLHSSYMHHGLPPMKTVNGREYPEARSSAAFEAFKKTREYKIHGIYEQMMLEVDTVAALAEVDAALLAGGGALPLPTTGHEAAVATVDLMVRAQGRLAPAAIIAADDPSGTQKERAAGLWDVAAIRAATTSLMADSVRLLAALWASAWAAGDGDSLPESKIVHFQKGTIQDIYRDREFAKARSLADMAQSGDFEP